MGRGYSTITTRGVSFLAALGFAVAVAVAVAAAFVHRNAIIRTHHKPLNVAKALQRFRAQSTAASSLDPSPDRILSVLKDAAKYKRVPKQEVQTLLTQFSTMVNSSERHQGRLDGNWELVYSTMIKGYMPVKEIIDFTAFSIATSFGPIPLGGIQGSSNILSDNPITVRFMKKAITLGPFKISAKTTEQPKDYTFYYLDDHTAIAKSSAGGWSLLRRVP